MTAAITRARSGRPPGIPVDVRVHVTFDLEQVLETFLVEQVLPHHVRAPIHLQLILYLQLDVTPMRAYLNIY